MAHSAKVKPVNGENYTVMNSKGSFCGKNGKRDKRRFMWAGHVWPKQGSTVKQVIEENPVRHRS